MEGLRLNLVDRRDHVGSEVDGDLPGNLNREYCPLFEKAFDALYWCGHGDGNGLRGRDLNPQRRGYESRLEHSSPLFVLQSAS